MVFFYTINPVMLISNIDKTLSHTKVKINFVRLSLLYVIET